MKKNVFENKQKIWFNLIKGNTIERIFNEPSQDRPESYTAQLNLFSFQSWEK